MNVLLYNLLISVGLPFLANIMLFGEQVHGETLIITSKRAGVESPIINFEY